MLVGNDVGIVLRRQYPFRTSVTLLSRVRGKIEVQIRASNALALLWPGMVVTYALEERARGFVAHTPYTEFSPQVQHAEQLEWLHYLLYVCFHVAPSAGPVPEIFDFLWQVLTTHADQAIVRSFQVASLVQLLSLFGLCDQVTCRPFLNFFQQITSVVDHADQCGVESAEEVERELKRLAPRVKQQILEALALHPRLRERRIIGFED